MSVSSKGMAVDSGVETKLHRFELNADQLGTFDRWVRFEQEHHVETVATMERERMYFEGIYRDREREPNVIYWLEVRGRGGATVNSSPLPIDKKYQEFMRLTLKKGSRRSMDAEYFLTPPFIEKVITEHGK